MDLDPYSIKQEDFTEYGLNYKIIYDKLTKIMEKDNYKKTEKLLNYILNPEI